MGFFSRHEPPHTESHDMHEGTVALPFLKILETKFGFEPFTSGEALTEYVAHIPKENRSMEHDPGGAVHRALRWLARRDHAYLKNLGDTYVITPHAEEGGSDVRPPTLH